jgi:hypothetical protein
MGEVQGLGIIAAHPLEPHRADPGFSGKKLPLTGVEELLKSWGLLRPVAIFHDHCLRPFGSDRTSAAASSRIGFPATLSTVRGLAIRLSYAESIAKLLSEMPRHFALVS